MISREDGIFMFNLLLRRDSQKNKQNVSPVSLVTSKQSNPMNQPIEEKWKEEFNKKFCSKTSEPKYSVWNAAALAYPEEIKSFIENLLEQERNHYEKELLKMGMKQ